MPHLVLEFSPDGLPRGCVPSMLEALRVAAAQLPTVSPANLKLRALESNYSYSGPDKTPHIHITFRLLPGRNDEMKNFMAKTLYDAARNFLDTKTGISVEILDLGIYLKD